MPTGKSVPKKKAQPQRKMVVVRTPNDPKYTQRVDAEAYAAMRKTSVRHPLESGLVDENRPARPRGAEAGSAGKDQAPALAPQLAPTCAKEHSAYIRRDHVGA